MLMYNFSVLYHSIKRNKIKNVIFIYLNESFLLYMKYIFMSESTNFFLLRVIYIFQQNHLLHRKSYYKKYMNIVYIVNDPLIKYIYVSHNVHVY